MSKMLCVLALACGVLLISSGAAPGSDSTQKGKGLFDQHCALCHGKAGIGQSMDDPGGGWDKDKSRLAPALDGTGHAWHHSPSLMFRYIEEGSIDESSPMPSFGDRLNNDEIRSIIAYIQSLWPEKLLQQYKKRFQDETR